MWVGCTEDEDELSFFHDLSGNALTHRGNRMECFAWKMVRPGRVAILLTHHAPHSPYQPVVPELVHWYDLEWQEFDYWISETLNRSIYLEIDLFSRRFQLESYLE